MGRPLTSAILTPDHPSSVGFSTIAQPWRYGFSFSAINEPVVGPSRWGGLDYVADWTLALCPSPGSATDRLLLAVVRDPPPAPSLQRASEFAFDDRIRERRT